MVPFSFASAFEFNGHEMRLVQGRALYWPRESALLVADLHLEKSSYFASHGQMLRKRWKSAACCCDTTHRSVSSA